MEVLDKVSGKKTVLCLLRDVLDEAGKPEESERRCREAAELKPKWAGLWRRIGLLAEGRDCPDEAMAAFEKAVELDLLHSTALRDRGLMLLDVGLAGDRADSFSFALV